MNPDEFYVHKPTLEAGRPAILRRNLGSKAIKMIYGDEAKAGRSVKVVDVDRADRARFALSDAEVTELAKQAMIIEKHYGRPMDIEWAKDGDDGKLYIVQARPETVKSRASATVMERYLLKEKGTVLVEGRAIGQRIGAGPVKVINDVSEMDKVQPGDVLVSDMTDPDWEPVMKRASAIVTNRGGRTCHAAIIARELAFRRWSVAATPPRSCRMAGGDRFLLPKAIPASSSKANSVSMCARTRSTPCPTFRSRS